MQLNAYLNFNGQCEEAFKFYEKVLGGKIESMFTHAGTPAEKDTPPEWLNKIIHATLSVGDSVLMGADGPPGQYKQPTGFCVILNYSDTAKAERVFQALAENGKVQMALQTTFWAERFGMLVDRFGIPWMINCGQPHAKG